MIKIKEIYDVLSYVRDNKSNTELIEYLVESDMFKNVLSNITPRKPEDAPSDGMTEFLARFEEDKSGGGLEGDQKAPIHEYFLVYKNTNEDFYRGEDFEPYYLGLDARKMIDWIPIPVYSDPESDQTVTCKYYVRD